MARPKPKPSTSTPKSRALQRSARQAKSATKRASVYGQPQIVENAVANIPLGLARIGAHLFGAVRGGAGASAAGARVTSSTARSATSASARSAAGRGHGIAAARTQAAAAKRKTAQAAALKRKTTTRRAIKKGGAYAGAGAVAGGASLASRYEFKIKPRPGSGPKVGDTKTLGGRKARYDGKRWVAAR